MLDKLRLAEILEKHISEGYKIIEGLSISNPRYGEIVLNIIQADRTIDQLKQEDSYDKAQAVVKNEDIEITSEDNFGEEE